MTDKKQPKKRTTLTAVPVYLPAEMVVALDLARGENSRGAEIRNRLARSLKTAKPVVSMGRPKRISGKSD